MRETILSMALVSLIAATPAFAQGGTSSVPKNTQEIKPIPEAPIGHRQPRRGEVPSENSISDPNNPENKEDAALDRKIKSICRGC